MGGNRVKICIPIIETTKEQILAEARKIATTEADLCEWRVDFYEQVKQPGKCLEILEELQSILLHQQLIFTLRTNKEGGEHEFSESEIVAIISEGIQSGLSDYVDIEAFEDEHTVSELISLAKNKGVSIIGSYHDFDTTPEQTDITKRLMTMEQMGFDVAKCAVMPQNKEDVLTLLQATRESKRQMNIPLITMSMGKQGMLTRVYGDAHGSEVTFATLEKASAPGQLSMNSLQRLRNQSIILTGFMGTGKTTIAKELNCLTGFPYFDTDERIEKEQNITIKEMFAKKGEAYFRDCETKLCKDIINEPASVIACGGGLVLREENVSLLKKKGFIICLSATPETIYERLKMTTNRPLLKDHMSIEGIQELVDSRKASYASAADLIVPVDNQSPFDVAWEILNRILFTL